MNATHPSPGPSDGEHEALHRAQRLHEPSMEEILASIRAIIADDRDSEPAKPPPARSTPSNEPRIVYSNDAPARMFAESAITPDREDPAMERAPADPAPAREPPAPPVVVSARPAAAPIAEPPAAEAETARLPDFTPEPEPEFEPEAALLSDEADRSVTASFEALSASIALQSAELLDRLTREMLRPMIKSWLDEHLPSMVERLVRAEIQRVARGGR